MPLQLIGQLTESALRAPIGDARPKPPWPQPKSLAAAPLVIFKQVLRRDSERRMAGSSSGIIFPSESGGIVSAGSSEKNGLPQLHG